MAGPSFLTPKPVSPSRSTRRFTLEQANRTLPLVRRIVSDIVKSHERVTALQVASVSATGKDQPAAQAELDRGVEQLQNYVDELAGIGCQLKDYQTGLIDFLGRHEGRDVCLCWKLGEEKIAYWHELSAGFAGRAPIETLKENL